MCRKTMLWLMNCALIAGLLSSQVLPASAQEPSDLLDDTATSLMEWETPLSESTSEQNLTIYEVESGQESSISADEVLDSSTVESDFVEGSFPPDLLISGASVDETEAFTDPTTVQSPTEDPWRMTVKLYATFAPSTLFECTGVLIDALHVLTAGHCVHGYQAGQKWASTVRVVSGYPSGSSAFGEAQAVYFYSWEGWTKNRNFDWNMAYIRLNRPLGALTGWYGYGYNNSDAFFKNTTFHNPYYRGRTMYYRSGKFDAVARHALYHNSPAFAGQSGSGAYSLGANRNRYVYGSLSHTQNNNSRTGFTRINADRFAAIRKQIAANTPGRADLVPLSMKITPSTVQAGRSLNTTAFLLHNYSSATWNGIAEIKVYLSFDSTITSADRLLATTTVPTQLPPKTSKWINMTPPTIPATIQGQVWIGVIVEVSDANRNNNGTSGWDAAIVQVYRPAEPSMKVYLPLLLGR